MPEYPEEARGATDAILEAFPYHSPEYKEIYAAFIQAQGEFTPVAKTKTAKVKGRTKTGAEYEYTYKYADQADVLAMALPVLTKHGLGLMQPHMWIDGRLRVATRLIHSSGQWLQSYGLGLPENLAPQDFGSLSTYWRRYDVCSLLGIAADEDVDGPGTGDREQKTENREQKTVRQPAAVVKATQPTPTSTPGEQLLVERDALIGKLKELVPDGKLLGQKAKAMFPEHQTTKTLMLADLQHLYEALLKEKADREKREAPPPERPVPSDIPPDVAAMFDEGTLTTASRLPPPETKIASGGPRLIGIPTIGKGLAQRLHKLIGIHKIHTEAELLEDCLKPLGLEHASDLPRDLYERLCDWAEGKQESPAKGVDSDGTE